MEGQRILPLGWELAKIGDIIKVQGGFAFKSKEFTTFGVPVVRIGDLQNGEVILSEKTAFFSSKQLEEFSNVQLVKGDVLMALSGATTGKAAVYKLDNPALLNQRVGRFLPHSQENIHEGFLQHLIKKLSEGILAQAWGGAQPNVSPTTIESNDIVVPPLPEQKRIATKIDALQAKSKKAREALDAARPLLDKLRQSILAAAFRGDLTADWRKQNPDVEPAVKLLERIRIERRQKWEEAELAKMRAKGKEPKNDKWKSKYKEPEPVDTTDLPELPKGWCWANFEEISVRVTVGHVGPMKNEYIDSGVPFLRSQNVRANRYSEDGLKFISGSFHKRLSKSALEPDDIVVVRSGDVGTACTIPSLLTSANCSDLVIIKQPKIIISAYGAYYINSIKNSYIAAGKVGVALTHFNTKSVAKIPVPIAPALEQTEIIKKLNKAWVTADNLTSFCNDGVKRCSSLDQSILAKAFRGELVLQDPNDESASVLLERIKAERALQKPKRGKKKPKKKGMA